MNSLLSPIWETPLDEVVTASEFAETLQRGFQYGLPGFVIRATYSPIIDDETIIGALAELTGNSYELKFHQKSVAAIASRASIGLGRLHEDVFEDEDASLPSINVHRTISGAGKVSLANAGLNYPKRDHPLYYETLRDMGVNFANGSTNSDLMLQKVYTTDVSAGDVIIFPTLTRLGATLHRFDTSEGPRDAEATIYQPIVAV